MYPYSFRVGDRIVIEKGVEWSYDSPDLQATLARAWGLLRGSRLSGREKERLKETLKPRRRHKAKRTYTVRVVGAVRAAGIEFVAWRRGSRVKWAKAGDVYLVPTDLEKLAKVKLNPAQPWYPREGEKIVIKAGAEVRNVKRYGYKAAVVRDFEVVCCGMVRGGLAGDGIVYFASPDDAEVLLRTRMAYVRPAPTDMEKLARVKLNPHVWKATPLKPGPWMPSAGEKVVIPKGTKLYLGLPDLERGPVTGEVPEGTKMAGKTYTVTVFSSMHDQWNGKAWIAWESGKELWWAESKLLRPPPTDMEKLADVKLNPRSKWVPRPGERVLVPKGTRNVRVYVVDAWRGEWAVDEYHAPRDLIVKVRGVSYASAEVMGFDPPADANRVTKGVGDDRIRMVFWGAGKRQRRALLADVRPVPTDLEKLAKVKLNPPKDKNWFPVRGERVQVEKGAEVWRASGFRERSWRAPRSYTVTVCDYYPSTAFSPCYYTSPWLIYWKSRSGELHWAESRFLGPPPTDLEKLARVKLNPRWGRGEWPQVGETVKIPQGAEITRIKSPGEEHVYWYAPRTFYIVIEEIVPPAKPHFRAGERTIYDNYIWTAASGKRHEVQIWSMEKLDSPLEELAAVGRRKR